MEMIISFPINDHANRRVNLFYELTSMIHFIPQTAKSSLALSLLLLLISISVFIIPSCCRRLGYSCQDSANDMDDPIDLSDLLSILYSKASTTNFTTEIYKHTYGMFLCRGDVSNEECSTCIRSAREEFDVVSCSRQGDAIMWFEKCMLRYAYQNFIGTLQMTAHVTLYGNVTSPETSDILAWARRLILDASSEELMFKAVVQDSDNPRYGLAQCTRDINNNDCNFCLTTLLNMSKPEQVVSKACAPNCCLRIETSLFFNSIPQAQHPSLTSPGPQAPHPSLPPPGTQALHPFLSAPAPPPDEERGNRTRIIVISISTVAAVTVLLGLLYCVFFWRKKRREQDRSEEPPLRHPHAKESVHSVKQHFDSTNQESDEDMRFFDFSTLKTATDDFSDANKLGEGGFGPVYKGKLINGEEIAVKRLSTKSSQGHKEFKNEAKIISKLQHNNLVRLFGCCVEGEEKLLVYEYMPNTSLDAFLFDPLKCKQLDWLKRENIVNGIARGLLYLHEDSRLKIIHRDLKASNVLLDEDMNPKISDFGTSRIFEAKQNDANTDKIVGTCGYIAPEYFEGGVFSMKSDVYSFGVLLLEVVSGRKNIGFIMYKDKAHNLVSYARELRSEDRADEMIDKNLVEDCPVSEAIRWIDIGLSCVQEDPNARPTMKNVVQMLGNQSFQLSQPSKRPFIPLTEHQSSTSETVTEYHTTDQSSTSATIQSSTSATVEP